MALKMEEGQLSFLMVKTFGGRLLMPREEDFKRKGTCSHCFSMVSSDCVSLHRNSLEVHFYLNPTH